MELLTTPLSILALREDHFSINKSDRIKSINRTSIFIVFIDMVILTVSLSIVVSSD